MFDYQLSPDYRFLNFKDIKKGSKLLVKSLKWYEANKEYGSIPIGSTFVSSMKSFCGRIVTVESFFKSRFSTEDHGIYVDGCEDASIFIKEDGGNYIWSLGMFQGIKSFKKGLNLE